MQNPLSELNQSGAQNSDWRETQIQLLLRHPYNHIGISTEITLKSKQVAAGKVETVGDLMNVILKRFFTPPTRHVQKFQFPDDIEEVLVKTPGCATKTKISIPADTSTVLLRETDFAGLQSGRSIEDQEQVTVIVMFKEP